MNPEIFIKAQANGALSNESLYLLHHYVQTSLDALSNTPYPEVSGAAYFLRRQRDELQRMIDARSRRWPSQ